MTVKDRTRNAKIMLTANSMRNLVHFRGPLLDAFQQRGFEIIALAPDDLAGEASPPAVCRSIAIDRAGLDPFRDWQTVRAYARALRDDAPDVLFGFTPKANIYGGLAARVARVPFIPTVSGLGTGFLKGGIVRSVMQILYRQAFRRSPIIFFQNPDDRDIFIERRLVRPQQARMAPGSGVDLDHFRPVDPPQAPPFRLLFIGRLLADKGLRELIEAVDRLRQGGRSIELTLVGSADEGNPSSIPQAERDNWQASGLAALLGHQVDVRPAIAGCHSVVLPSYREGLPRSLLEASAMGRPMIATDVPGCREIVRDGETGILCQSRDAASLADAIDRMMSLQGKERARMGSAARELVEKRFGQAQVVDLYLGALASIGVG